MFSLIKPIISIAIGFGVSCLFCTLLMFIAMIPSALFKVIKIRPYAFIAIAIINFAGMMKYSAINIIWIIASMILFVIMLIKYYVTVKLSRQPDRALKDDFDKANSQEWAYLYAFALFSPIFLNIHYLSHQYFGTEQMSIFKFYWMIDYTIIKYALLLTPIILLCMTGHSAYTYGQDAVRDLAEERKQKEKEEQAEQNRLENLNPDRLDNVLADADINLPGADILESNVQQEFEEYEDTENILQNIMDNLNK